MKIEVQLFAVLRERIGKSEISLEVPERASCSDVFSLLEDEQEGLKPLLERCALAVNGEYVDRGVSLSAGDEVAILPPVSGG